MRIPFGALALLLCLATSGWSMPSEAQSHDDDARVHFRLGRAYYESGRFQDAAREFQQAYDMSHRSELLYNVFVAWRDAGELGPAIAALRQFIAELAPQDRERFQAQLENMQRIEQQRAGSATSDTGTSDATIDGNPAAAPTNDGEQATSDGVTMPPGGSASPEETTGHLAPWILAGAGGALAIGGVVTGIMALSAQNDLKDRCDASGACPPGWESTRNRGRTLAIVSDVLLIGGGVVVAGGLLWLLLGRRHSSEGEPTVGIVCAPGGCAASAHFVF